jgi:hypothetical protein
VCIDSERKATELFSLHQEIFEVCIDPGIKHRESELSTSELDRAQEG